MKMKIFFRKAPLLHLIERKRKDKRTRRLCGITGWGNGTSSLDFWKSVRKSRRTECENLVELKVYLLQLLCFEGIKWEDDLPKTSQLDL